mmetsp:Transcript_7191/g.10948  ORF Transcript_7191/g.10948 Transcript_7191/m.10948 type:complete len:583 (+) Transcript_7191:87-1835(+)
MGFPTSLVLETGSLHEEFVCSVCLSIVEHPVLTKCSHVFCKNCLNEWLAQKRNCPKCKTNLENSDDILPLETASPLAWRILRRVRVRCPLHTQGCTWKGDYGDVGAHLTSSKTHKIDEKTSGPAKRAMERAQAEAFKKEGNQQFLSREFKQAIVLYNKAISLAPDMFQVYANRSAAYLQLQRLEESLADAQKSISLNPNYVTGHRRLMKALCEMGEFMTAKAHLERYVNELKGLEGDHSYVLQLAQGMQDGESAMKEGKFSEAREIFLMVSKLTNSEVPILMALRAELKMGSPGGALRRSFQILRKNRKNVGAYVVRAWALYLQKDVDQALKNCREALRLDPDSTEAKALYRQIKGVFKELSEARKFYNERKFEDAVEGFTSAIDKFKESHRSPLWASLFSQRAQAYRRLKRWEECLADCKEAIQTQYDNKTAWTTRASALIEIGKANIAEKDMQKLLENTFQNDSIITHWRDKANFEVRKVRRPKYYKMLDVPRVASEREIKVAYKRKALELHPDRVAGQRDEKKTKIYERKFKDLGEALEILTDPMKRQLYDEGFDKQAIEERVAAAQRAAHNHGSNHHH